MKNSKTVHSYLIILLSLFSLTALLHHHGPNQSKVITNHYQVVNFSTIENPIYWRKNTDLYNLSRADLEMFFAYKEEQYAARADRIFRFCPLLKNAANHPSQKSTLCRQDDQRCLMVVNPVDKLAFCRNAKVSSTAWLARFHILWQNASEESPSTLSKEETENFHENAGKWWRLSQRKKMAYLTRSGALLSFVMVRHPLDRLVSAYYDKIIGEPSKTNFKKIVEKIKEKYEITQAEVSPAEFVRFVIDEGKCQNWHQINEHWRPQSANCPFCHFKYQVYGHYETAEEDTAYILLKSNLTGKLKKVGKINSSHNLNPQERRNAFWKAVPAHYVLDLKKMFYWDFKLFDYN